MKKSLCFIMTMVLGIMLLTACGSSSNQSNGTNVQNQNSVHDTMQESNLEDENNTTQESNLENENNATETNVQEKIEDTPDNQPASETVGEEQTETTDSTDAQTRKALVVYYSASGNTKAVGDAIAQYTDADIFEIIPVNAYSNEDLDWTQEGSRVNLEHEDESLQDIELVSTTVDNFDSYDTVFIGYPIWWHEAAWVVNRFVKDNDFTGKTVIPFCTSSSSDMGESGTHLAQMAGTGNWQEGMRFSASTNDSEVTKWLDGIDF